MYIIYNDNCQFIFETAQNLAYHAYLRALSWLLLPLESNSILIADYLVVIAVKI